MTRPSVHSIAVLLAIGAAAGSVAAHEGHGGPNPHWHATDAWGFIVLAVIVAGAVAWWRGRS